MVPVLVAQKLPKKVTPAPAAKTKEEDDTTIVSLDIPMPDYEDTTELRKQHEAMLRCYNNERRNRRHAEFKLAKTHLELSKAQNELAKAKKELAKAKEEVVDMCKKMGAAQIERNTANQKERASRVELMEMKAMLCLYCKSRVQHRQWLNSL